MTDAVDRAARIIAATDAVERVDKYTVRVDGVTVVAGTETESRLRQMDAEQRRMFGRIMRDGGR